MKLKPALSNTTSTTNTSCCKSVTSFIYFLNHSAAMLLEHKCLIYSILYSRYEFYCRIQVKNILLLNLLLVIVSSCYYDNGEALYPNADINCDTANVTFTPVASEIIYQSCATTNCHVAGTGRVLLTNYQEIKSTIDNGLFVQRTIYAQDMPPQGPLSPCNIKKLTAWIENGALND